MTAAPIFRLLCALLCLPVTPLALAEVTLPPAGALAFGPAPETLAVPGDSGDELHTVDPAHESDALTATGPLPGIAPEVTPAPQAGVFDANQGSGLLVTEPRRGPPACGPETHIGAFAVPGASLIWAEAFSTPHTQRGRGAPWLEIAEGEHPAVWVHNARIRRPRGFGRSGYTPLTPHPSDPMVSGGAINYRGRYQAAAGHTGIRRLPRDWDVHHTFPQQLRPTAHRLHRIVRGRDIDSPTLTRGLIGDRYRKGLFKVGPKRRLPLKVIEPSGRVRFTNPHKEIDREIAEFLKTNPSSGRFQEFRDYLDWRWQHVYWEARR